MATKRIIRGQAVVDRVVLVAVRKTTSDAAEEVMEQLVVLHHVGDLVVVTEALVEEMAVVMVPETEVVTVALDLPATRIAVTKDPSIDLPATLVAIIALRVSHLSSTKITTLSLPTSRYSC